MASDTWGGAEIHTLALTATLAERGHECSIVELDQPVFTSRRPTLPGGAHVMRLRLGSDASRPGLVAAYRLLRLLRGLRADVGVFAKGWPTVGTTLLDLACRLAFRGRFLTIEHLTPEPRPPRTTGRHLGGLVPGIGLWWYADGLKVYARSIFPKRIVTISRAVACGLIDDYGFPEAKVVTITNGVDTARFRPDAESRREVRTRWGVPADAIVYGVVGRFSNFHKGHDIAVELFSRLKAANPERDLWCVLVGEGPDEDALKAQARASGHGDHIVFPGPTEKPWEAYSGMDVFLMTSRFEGLGLALLEAMACGCCPVVMAVGGIKEVVTEPALGWSAPAGDRAAFLRGMQAALDTGGHGRRIMGERARRHVIEHFSAPEQYGKLADLIEGI